MNKDFYNDLDTNFEQAYTMSEKKFTHEEITELLKNGNIPQKQIAALNFDYLKDKNDGEILISNLTGCDGKIREAAALSIHRILSEDKNARKILAEISPKILAAATIDINSNICRLVVDSAVILKSDKNFSEQYTTQIIKYINEALEEIDKFIFRDKKYVINKQIFKLYWCLESLSYFYDYVNPDILRKISEKAAAQSEYTIREKVAVLLKNSEKFPDITEKLKTDSNYYVRAVFN